MVRLSRRSHGNHIDSGCHRGEDYAANFLERFFKDWCGRDVDEPGGVRAIPWRAVFERANFGRFSAGCSRINWSGVNRSHVNQSNLEWPDSDGSNLERADSDWELSGRDCAPDAG